MQANPSDDQESQALVQRAFIEAETPLIAAVSPITRRVLIWALFLGLVSLLRPFYPVLLGTFFLGYMSNSLVRWSARKFGERIPRRAWVLGFYASIVAFISAFSLLTIPRAFREGNDFVQSLQSSNPYVVVTDSLRSTIGDELFEKLEYFVILSMEPGSPEGSMTENTREVLDNIPSSFPPRHGNDDATDTIVSQRISRSSADVSWRNEQRAQRLAQILQNAFRGRVLKAARLATTLLSATTKMVIKFIVSLLFSFLIMWDLPRVKRSIESLQRSSLRAVYNEVAPPLAEFVGVLGKSFEAQSLIAVVNTALTTLGLLILQIPGVWFISTCVFLSSFVPVAGVLISTLPMLIVALTEFGAGKAFSVLVMVLVVHLIEAYVLNPQIYSSHLHLPPLLVLVVLYIAEHSFGISGLLFAVPLSVYVIRALKIGDEEQDMTVGDTLL